MNSEKIFQQGCATVSWDAKRHALRNNRKFQGSPQALGLISNLIE